MALETQLGVKKETTWGTAVVVDRFYEYVSESVKPEVGRVESNAMRAGQRVQRSDRFVPYVMGAAGSLELEVLTKGFGFWLEHMLGTVNTSGPTDSAYSHVGTVGSLLSKGITYQVNRPFSPSGTSQPFTYEGGKVAKWSLYGTTEGLCIFSAELVFEDESTVTALATASYPTDMEHLSWAGAAVTIDGSSVPVTDFKVECDNGLKTDRLKMRSNTKRQEPLEAKQRMITWELGCDFDSLTQRNRVMATLAASAVAPIVCTWTGPSVIGAGSTYPSLAVRIDAARFDAIAGDEQGGTDPLEQKLSGRGLYDGTDSPLTVTYVTADSTP